MPSLSPSPSRLKSTFSLYLVPLSYLEYACGNWVGFRSDLWWSDLCFGGPIRFMVVWYVLQWGFVGLIDFCFCFCFFLFSDDGGDAVVGLWFGCDFGGWGLWFWVVVIVVVVVVAIVVVEWVLCLMSCVCVFFFFFLFLFFFFFFSLSLVVAGGWMGFVASWLWWFVAVVFFFFLVFGGGG